MKSPIRKAVPGKYAEGKSREVKPKSGPAARDQRSLHAVGRAATHQRRGESLGDFAYRTMREAIRSGKFRSGEHLRQLLWSMKIVRSPTRNWER